MIAVVIPYFQRETGVLRRALASIVAQKNCRLPVHVVIVDDASPVPAETEAATIDWPQSIHLQIVHQPNQGPGSARNTGLASVPPGTVYVAFLDSDDEWSPDHLSRAVTALDQGFDFYFADLLQLGQTVGAFARAGRVRIGDHPALPGDAPNLHAYQGDMIDQIIRGNLIGTPTVVYRLDRHAAVRFRVEYTNAGEDYLFWMEVASNGARIAFSSQIETTCGRGVNVYAGSGWGSEQHLLRVHNELRFRKTTCELFELTDAQRQHVAAAVRKLRVAFARDLLHRVAHRKQLPGRLLWRHLRMDPWSFIGLPALAYSIWRGRA